MARGTDLSRYLPAVPDGPAKVALHMGPLAVPERPKVPDFVISGVMLSDGRVRVYASRDVQSAVTNVDYRWSEPRPDRPRRPDATLTFRLREFVLVERDDIRQCLAEVERIWRTEP